MMMPKWCDRTSLALTLLLALSCLTRCVAAECYGTRPHPNGICGERLSQLQQNVCDVVRILYPEHFRGDSAVVRTERSTTTSGKSRRSRAAMQRRRRYLSKEQHKELAERLRKDYGMDLKLLINEMEARVGRGISPLPKLGAGVFYGDKDGFVPHLHGASPYGQISEPHRWIDSVIARGLAHRQLKHIEEVPDIPETQELSKRVQAHNRNKEQESANIISQSPGGDNSASSPLPARGKRNLVCECCYNNCSIQTVALYC